MEVKVKDPTKNGGSAREMITDVGPTTKKRPLHLRSTSGVGLGQMCSDR